MKCGRRRVRGTIVPTLELPTCRSPDSGRVTELTSASNDALDLATAPLEQVRAALEAMAATAVQDPEPEWTPDVRKLVENVLDERGSSG